MYLMWSKLCKTIVFGSTTVGVQKSPDTFKITAKIGKSGPFRNRRYILLDFNCRPYLARFKYITWRSLFSGFNLWIIIDQLQLVFKLRIGVGISHPHTNFAKTTPKSPKVEIQPIHAPNTLVLIGTMIQFSNM